jgi:hypothetical protein
MEGTFFGTAVKSVFPETSENFFNVLPVILDVVGVNEDVVQIHNDCDVEKVGEDIVHEMLECGGGVGKSEWHNTPLIRTVSSPEGGFPLVSFGDADKMVCMSEIYLGVDPGFARGVQQIFGERKWVAVLLGNFVKSAEIHTESEGAILLSNEEDWCSEG